METAMNLNADTRNALRRLKGGEKRSKKRGRIELLRD